MYRCIDKHKYKGKPKIPKDRLQLLETKIPKVVADDTKYIKRIRLVYKISTYA